ncbi:MAG TPA: hypothetical protein VGO89_21405 [Streptomyces sp.]|jgi:hypothetical protein|nr:hypothetical protein [Streptomyces sp.]
MATETTKTDKNDETGAAPETDNDKATATDANGSQDVTKAEDTGRDDDLADDDRDIVTDSGARTGVLGRGLGSGAAAVVSAGLGLASLTGTSLSEMLRERKQMIAQIEASSQQQGGGASPSDQITAAFSAPWHATALFNGVFALLAVVVGGVLFARVAKQADSRSWVKSVALGGVILGVLGLLVAGGMYFDILAGPPTAPEAPAAPPAG